MRQPPAARGSALLVVLWVIALLSFLIVTSMMVAMQDVETVAARRLVFRARQLAESGVAIAASPVVQAGDPVLRKQVGPMESYEAAISTEEARLNLNSLLTEERRPVLERLFESWGLRPMEAQEVVDALMDWVDPDDFKRLKGAEKQDYRKEGFNDRPYNRPFESLDQVMLVRGMDRVAEANPKWRDAFTLWGGGALDVNEAPPELIAIVADVPVGSVRALVTTRNGPDGIPHTADDQPIKSLEELAVLLGASGPRATAGQALFTLHGSVMRIDSVGRAGSYTRRISVVLQKGSTAAAGPGARSPVLEWRESSGD